MSRSHERWPLLLLLAAALLSAAARGEEPAPEGDLLELRKVERVQLDDVNPGVGGERVVELFVRALTRFGDPVEQLRPVDIEIREDGQRIDPAAVTVTPLSATGHGVACVLAIDRSRVMTGDPFEREKAAAVSFFDRLGSHDRVAVLAFSGASELVVPFSSPRVDARERVLGLKLDADALSTVVYDGVYQALGLLRQEPGLPRRSIVIVLSDGKDGGSTHSLDDVIAFAAGDASRPRVSVFSIGYSHFGGSGLEALRRLSAETGGDFQPISSNEQINSFYDAIWRQIMQSYVVRFPSSMDGRPHAVEVLIEGHRDSRTASYPSIRRPLWPFLSAGAGALVLALGIGLLVRRRSPGRLVFVAGARAGESVALRSGITRIGALSDNDVVIASRTVSRYHAQIRARRGRVEIEDLRSGNGTQVNGTAIRSSPLHPGDQIRIADVDLVYER